MKTLRTLLVVAASGAALTLAFPEADLAPVAWVALAPMLLVCRDASPARAAAYGFTFGLFFFGSLLIWISIVGYVAWFVLTVLQAAFVALFAWVLSLTTARRSAWWLLLVAPAAWVAIVEFLRAVFPTVGFTWGALAQSQHDQLWLLRAAGLGGSWLVALLVVLANAGIAMAVHGGGKRDLKVVGVGVGFAVVALASPLLIPVSSDDAEPVRVAIVQGNVPEDFTGSFYDKELSIVSSHARLTEELAGEDVDLVVWPESSVGLDIRRDPQAAQAVYAALDAVDAPMVVGANIDLDDRRYKVVAFHLEPGRGIVDTYEKTHLVPFGEYVPARELIDWIPMLDQVPRDAVPGSGGKVFPAAGGNVAPVISFEGDFGSLVRSRIDGGGRLLIVATNTSTWERSAASAQHVAFSQVRAAENGVWVVHAAVSGISAFITPHGEVEERIPMWTADAAIHDVTFADDITLYARVGDWLPFLSMAIVLAALASGAWQRRRGVAQAPS